MKKSWIANIATATNGFCGALSILMSIEGQFDIAAILLLVSMVADFLDGRIARDDPRTRRRTSGRPVLASVRSRCHPHRRSGHDTLVSAVVAGVGRRRHHPAQGRADIQGKGTWASSDPYHRRMAVRV